MRWIGWLALILLGGIWLAGLLPDGPVEVPQQGPDLWRRTVDGWERATWLSPPPPPHRKALHPLVVAVLQWLLAALVLLAFSRKASGRIPPEDRGKPRGKRRR